jgi:hypothetical protein
MRQGAMTIFSRPPCRPRSNPARLGRGLRSDRPSRVAARGAGHKPFVGRQKGGWDRHTRLHTGGPVPLEKKADGGSAASPVSGSGDGRLSSRAISGNAFTFLT